MRLLNLVTSEKIARRLSWTGLDQLDPNANISFSQMGEDRILSVIFQGKEKGFYVDVGAHHPKLYSNTYLFYLNGWNGINIDPMPESMKMFNEIRPNDINLEIAIGKKRLRSRYYMFSNSAVNTFSRSHLKRIEKMGEHKLIGTRTIRILPLGYVLKRHVKKGQVIDFLSVDVEGKDLDVLLSNDWRSYRPRVIVVEDLEFNLSQPLDSPIYRLLINKGYNLYSKAAETLIFKDMNFSK